MAYDPQTGLWTPETEDVSTRLTGMLASDNPYMTAAKTKGYQAANKRGMLNSTMGIQAGEMAAIDAALPIASQEASQAHAANLADAGRRSQETIASMNTAANDRQYSSAAAAQASQTYQAAYKAIMDNTNLSAADRTAQLRHIAAVRDSDMALIEQIYGIDLDWATLGPAEPPVTPPATPPGGATGGTGTAGNMGGGASANGPAALNRNTNQGGRSGAQRNGGRDSGRGGPGRA